MGFPDRLLTEYELGHRDVNPEDDDEPLPIGGRNLTRLMHAMRGAKTVRASFAVDHETGRVTERAA